MRSKVVSSCWSLAIMIPPSRLQQCRAGRLRGREGWKSRSCGPRVQIPTWALLYKLTFVAGFRSSMNLLKNELAYRHASLQLNRQGARVPDLELNGVARKIRDVLLVSKSCVNGRSGYVHAYAEAGNAAFSL